VKNASPPNHDNHLGTLPKQALVGSEKDPLHILLGRLFHIFLIYLSLIKFIIFEVSFSFDESHSEYYIVFNNYKYGVKTRQ